MVEAITLLLMLSIWGSLRSSNITDGREEIPLESLRSNKWAHMYALFYVYFFSSWHFNFDLMLEWFSSRSTQLHSPRFEETTLATAMTLSCVFRLTAAYKLRVICRRLVASTAGSYSNCYSLYGIYFTCELAYYDIRREVMNDGKQKEELVCVHRVRQGLKSPPRK